MSKKKKIVIAAGGSGGHLYPAIGLAKQLLSNRKDLELLFIASGLETNPFFDQKQFPYRSISAGTFRGWSIGSALGACKNIAFGYVQSRKILQAHQPDLVIGFGSYHTFPLLLAASSKGYPIALHEQNSTPGRVIRYFSDKALVTGVYFSSAIPKLKGKSVQLAMPLREGYQKGNGTKEHAYRYFNIDPTKVTVLVFGGSQGAQFINRIVSETLVRLQNEKMQFQVLHFTGNLADPRELQELYAHHGIHAVVKKYEECMELAWQVSDFCITRSGAGTIAEQLEFEVPGILIPYPHSADGHQDSNADFFVNVAGGGWKYSEKELNVIVLEGICRKLFDKACPLLKEKSANLLNYRQQSCKREFVSIINEILEK
ncbi:MAG: UDP-N-acetylglucosamine--N-acetylmuramyl-(pentapeptide) pyrophosphoryl-undecaprenol N-acetylglucosamine transferase [Parachlamydiaceae bacterium]|nr:UDP-N-acetylglucosamine--N-acetylmuramyl-(pentapeptide) pyrophosphoryl-undecaprenol N-acetylglucosamine transferase [Parachlamydiaceae bacterium]